MTNALLIAILVMVLITMICTIITTVITAKEAKAENTVFKILKISGVILLIVAVILTAVGVSYLKDDNTTKNVKVTLETAGFKNVSLSEYLELIKKPEKSIILVARPTCGFCEQFTPVLKQAKEDMNLTVNYVNTDDFSQEDWNTFNNSLSYLNSVEWGTPLILIVQNGEAIAENQGYVELSTIKEFFKNNGFGA